MTAQAKASKVSETDSIEQRIREGSYREAVTLCVEQYGAVLGRTCMAWLGSQAEAEEAVQEVLVAAYQGMGSYRADGSVKAWLFGIARRTCARRLETRVRRQQRLRLVTDQGMTAQPDDLLDAHRKAEKVRWAISQLKPTEREAVVLRYQADLSFEEVAGACGIDCAAARKRASRALLRLRKLLSEEGNHE